MYTSTKCGMVNDVNAFSYNDSAASDRIFASSCSKLATKPVNSHSTWLPKHLRYNTIADRTEQSYAFAPSYLIWFLSSSARRSRSPRSKPSSSSSLSYHSVGYASSNEYASLLPKDSSIFSNSGQRPLHSAMATCRQMYFYLSPFFSV